MKKTYNIAGREITVKETIIDRVISYISPANGAKRLHSRAQMAVFGAISGGYSTSKTRRTLYGWNTKTLDADSAMLPDLPVLRDDCNDLARKNPLAFGAINTSCTNIVGTGLRLQSRIDREVLNMTDDEADAWESTTEREFRLWAETKDFCDIERKQNFAGLQNLALRSTFDNGDIFGVMPYIERTGCPYGLKVQLVEASRVCNPNNQADSESIAGGIEKNKETGEAVAYHIASQHPGNALYKTKIAWNKIDAFNETGRRNVIHLFKQLRVGQTRGLPFLTPVIEAFKQLGRYTEAELAAAVVAACFTVFIKTKTGDGELNTIVTDSQASGQAGQSPTNGGYKLVEGGVVELAEGEDITTASPGRPNALFDPFVTAILRQIGVALELPYEILVKHFLASYSAARASLLEAWKFFTERRKWLADNFCQPIYELWMDEAIALGRISAPGYYDDPLIRMAYLGSLWVGPSRGMIDETKEVGAAVQRMEAGLTTHAEETPALTGTDWEKKVPQMRKEQRILKEIGLLPTQNNNGGGNNQQHTPDAPPDSNQNNNNTP